MKPLFLYQEKTVAPLAGAWIEILHWAMPARSAKSLPSRERGLKSDAVVFQFNHPRSLPSRERGLKSIVSAGTQNQDTSLPSRERGLKSSRLTAWQKQSMSLPSRERGLKYIWRANPAICQSRSPRGSVD